jgi:ribonuclease I
LSNCTARVCVMNRIITLSVFLFLSSFLSTRAYDFLRWPFNGPWQSVLWKLREKSTWSECQSYLPPLFTIHGLWPSNFCGKHPNNCGSFDKTKITRTLRSELQLLRPYYRRAAYRSQEYFWNSEYSKHGSCTTQYFTHEEYFEDAIALVKAHNVTRLLEQHGIIVSPNMYPPEFWKCPITINTAGFVPKLICMSPVKDHLHEVHIC